jgi:hypothetical protein
VTGYGCSPAARLAPACRYAIEPPTREMGRIAATLLIDALRDDRALDPTIVRLEASMIDLEVGRTRGGTRSTEKLANA